MLCSRRLGMQQWQAVMTVTASAIFCRGDFFEFDFVTAIDITVT